MNLVYLMNKYFFYLLIYVGKLEGEWKKIDTEGEQKHNRRSPLCIIHVLCNLPLVPLNCLHDKQVPSADEKEINLTQYPVHLISFL